MDLDLYALCERTQVIEMLEGALVEYCDGRFVTYPGGTLCFFDHGNARGQAKVVDPEDVVWWVADLDADPQEDDWFPRAAREHKPHFVFLRLAGDESYTFVGQGRICSLGGWPGDVSVKFSLVNRLPRELWHKLSGFDGWVIYVNHKAREIPKGDAKRFDKVIEDLAKRKSSHFATARYEGDSLEVFFNRHRAWVMYLRSPGDTGLYLKAAQIDGDEEEEEFFRCRCGIDLEFPRENTVEHSLAFEIIREYLATGELPARFEWTDEVP